MKSTVHINNLDLGCMQIVYALQNGNYQETVPARNVNSLEYCQFN